VIVCDVCQSDDPALWHTCNVASEDEMKLCVCVRVRVCVCGSAVDNACLCVTVGLLQGDNKPNGHGHHKETSGVVPLLECARMHLRLPADVHQLLQIQQTRRRTYTVGCITDSTRVSMSSLKAYSQSPEKLEGAQRVHISAK